MSVVASIIICTCNRAESLRETLKAIGHVHVPADLPTELLVVDNASTDRTREVVESTDLPNMRVRYVHEPRKGKGYAYNTGMAAAEGSIFLFTDDDVRPSTNWIDGMCRPISRGEADVVAGGVRIPHELERPWLRGHLRNFVASTESLEARPEPSGMVGANMAFGRHVLALVPQFDPALGPGALGFGDESLFYSQLVEAGCRVAARWQVAVSHHFDSGRLTRHQFRQIAAAMGRSRAYVAYHWEHEDLRLPWVHLLYVHSKLTLRKLLAAAKGNAKPQAWEMGYISQVHMIRQFLKERTQPRNYSKRGLILRDSTMSRLSERSTNACRRHRFDIPTSS